MGSSVKWLIQPTIILMENWGAVDAAEIKHELSQLVQLLNQASHKVDIIADIQRLEEISVFNLPALPEVMQFLEHPNRGSMTIIPSENATIHFWSRMLSTIGGVQSRFMASVEEAVEFLQRPTNPSEKPDQASE